MVQFLKWANDYLSQDVPTLHGGELPRGFVLVVALSAIVLMGVLFLA